MRIDEIKEDAVVTSYTRWLEAVIAENVRHLFRTSWSR